MIDANYKKIKERIKIRSLEIWGIEDESLMDPVIELLLDVFAYELAKVHQSINISDAKLLERLAKILVSQNWSLPSPAHALLRIIPSTDEYNIDRKTHFYYPKMDHGEFRDLFFTPVRSHNLINADIRCIAYGNQLILKDQKGNVELELRTEKDKRITDYHVWAGIQVDKKLLKKIKKLPICLLLSNSLLDMYLTMVTAYDVKGQPIKMEQIHAANDENEHYFETVNRYYKNYLYELDLEKTTKDLISLSAQFSDLFDQDEPEQFEETLFWVKFSFPVAFTTDELTNLEISLNTFPIVNRRLTYRQHNISRNGKVVSLSTHANEQDFFLNVEKLMDDRGQLYQVALQNAINNLPGSYALYFGDVDQFDERNAKEMLNKVIQSVREEGSAFSAIGYDLLNAYLEDLNSKLDVLEKKVSSSYRNVNSSTEKQYLLTIPFETSKTYECEYWKTNADMANGIPKNTKLNQYQSVEIKSYTVLLQTETVGGIIRATTKEKINSLRYGLIARERIVSAEDIKAFVKTTVGQTVKNVTVKLGVGVSENPKQGLIRTTQVVAELADHTKMSGENKKRLAHYLQSELQHKSIQSVPYQVIIS